MLIGICVSCRISYSIVSYLYVSFSGLITSVGEEKAIFLLSFTCNYVFFVRGGGRSSYSWCLGYAAIFYYGTPWAFHIIIEQIRKIMHSPVTTSFKTYSKRFGKMPKDLGFLTF